ncbi:EthD family reductase [Gordonia sp. NPDC062954]|uniref:EthD family reductase n=1 Tax=Gordonia sp. NPDC062954 TaxID=3364003 RepID=UPI0037C8A3FA
MVCYGHPTEPADFDEYYTTTHRPLADKIPGVRTWHAGKVSTLDAAKPPYYLVAVLSFDSRDALDEGLASPEGQAAAADIGNFATGGATLFVTDDFIPAA